MKAGHILIAAGGRTGRDGLKGATFSSVSLTTASHEEDQTAVQIGNPIEEKKVAEAPAVEPPPVAAQAKPSLSLLEVMQAKGVLRKKIDAATSQALGPKGALAKLTSMMASSARTWPISCAGLRCPSATIV